MFCAGSHEAQERVQAPLQGNLISMNSHAEEIKEWYFYRPAEGKAQEAQGTSPHHPCSTFSSSHHKEDGAS